MTLPPLSTAELRRLFPRLPGLNDLGPQDRRLLTAGLPGTHERRGPHRRPARERATRHTRRLPGRPRHPEVLTDLGLLIAGPDLLAHPWTAHLLTEKLALVHVLHERAVIVRLRRFQEQRAGYADLVDLPRHVSLLGRYTHVAAVAAQGAEMLGDSLAAAAYLSQIRPLIPSTERDWLFLADEEFGALLRAGDLPAAMALLRVAQAEIAARAATDPSNTHWQRDLSISHGRLGELAQAVGDATGAAEHYQAGLTIRERAAATDPTNTQWQRDLSISQEKLDGVSELTDEVVEVPSTDDSAIVHTE